jgi:hypothetical protein
LRPFFETLASQSPQNEVSNFHARNLTRPTVDVDTIKPRPEPVGLHFGKTISGEKANEIRFFPPRSDRPRARPNRPGHPRRRFGETNSFAKSERNQCRAV